MADNAKSTDGLRTTSLLGQPVDWAWLPRERSEWGVHPKPSPRGVTMLDVAVGTHGTMSAVDEAAR